MQYFDTVFKKEPMKYEFDFPIFLNETAIIRDIVDNKILLRNIFTNIGNSDIVAIEIVGVLKDIFGNPIIYKGCDNFSYIY